jgi:NADH-quinone oxidoreductase subunit C
MAGKLEQLRNDLEAALGSRVVSLAQALGEITVVVNAAEYLAAAQTLRDDPRLAFAQLMDLCGVDYSAYGDGAPASREQGSRLRDATDRESGAGPSGAGAASASGVTSPEGAPVPPSGGPWKGARFAATSQLLSIEHNWRVRLRVFAPDDAFPVVDTLTGIWNNANWYEREAFDLFGIMFSGHPDLRRILTDYGFIGHPFRKDFPLSGHVEMRYDPLQQRVIYQPVTIEPREITPRVIREEQYGDPGKR